MGRVGEHGTRKHETRKPETAALSEVEGTEHETPIDMMQGNYEDWGNIDFQTAWDKQKQLFDLAIKQRKNNCDLGFKDTLIVCEHPHVFTLGRNANHKNILIDAEAMHTKNIQCIKIDRGGDITYHGPGQIVGYPIINLKNQGFYIKDYIQNLEEVIIRCLRDYDIEGTRLLNAPGVWLDMKNHGKTRKIASVGVRSSRFITMHGFALNVNTDMSYYTHINPCGFDNEAMISMEQVLGEKTDIENVKLNLKNHFSEIFNLELRSTK
ncbi:MAG: lipoyl(octanoyl) transferase LipB [Bacteroidales bacterium]